MNVPFDNRQTHSHTQALWRFLKNEQVGIADLAKPLLHNALESLPSSCQEVALVMHDWSMLHLNHQNKQDRWQRTHKNDVGYELQSSLLVSDITGLPIAPIAQNLVTANGVLSSYQEKIC